MIELTEEQQMIRDTVRDFAAQEIAPIAAEIDENMTFPENTVKQMSELGLLGIPFPEEYGGAGLDTLSYTIVVEELAKVCASHALTVAAHTSLGTYPIALFGNEAQKQKYLPKLASGEWLACFGLTEPAVGSDVGNLKCTAEKVDGGFKLNGSKAFITNAGYAEVIIAFAVSGRNEDGKNLITSFILEKEMAGIAVGEKEKKMGWRASDTRQIHFDDVFVPEEQVLGTVGEGFTQAMIILDGGRISIAAMSLGIARGALEAALGYAKERKQFGKPVSDFQAIQLKIADMATSVNAAELLTYHASLLKDAGKDFRMAAYMAKLYASETATRVANDAIQIHGGYGFVKEYPVERFYRDAKGCEIGEGTSEVQRILISKLLMKQQ
ncbi:acyl-CoA dehydrogenase family protein [candidate division KSB1 bacterium]